MCYLMVKTLLHKCLQIRIKYFLFNMEIIIELYRIQIFPCT